MAKNEALIFKQWDSQGRIQRHVTQKMLEKLDQETDAISKELKSLIEKTSSANFQNEEKLSDFCIHTAFDGPVSDTDGNDQIPDRESIEVRCFALFE